MLWPALRAENLLIETSSELAQHTCAERLRSATCTEHRHTHSNLHRSLRLRAVAEQRSHRARNNGQSAQRFFEEPFTSCLPRSQPTILKELWVQLEMQVVVIRTQAPALKKGSFFDWSRREGSKSRCCRCHSNWLAVFTLRSFTCMWEFAIS